MNQELMTLDFWQDTVIYEGKTLPVGALACDALNVPADTIAKMNEQCEKINLLLGILNAGQDASALCPIAREATLAMLDIDHFKNINDTYGHLFGDQAIEHVSGLIRDCTEKHNGTGFRYGGEEMVVIFENKTLEETVAIMDSLRNDIKNTYIKNGDEAVCVKVSVGVSAYPETTQQINTLIDRADKAMYYSKQNGRDRLTVDGTFEGEE